MWPKLSERGEKEELDETREGVGQGALYIGSVYSIKPLTLP